MPCEFVTMKSGYGPPMDFRPTGVTGEWEASVNGEHRGYFTAEQVARAVVDAVFEGAPVHALFPG